MNGWDWLLENHWLWALAAFLLGAILTWLLLVKRFAVRTANVTRSTTDRDLGASGDDRDLGTPEGDRDLGGRDHGLGGTGAAVAGGTAAAGLGAATLGGDDDVDLTSDVTTEPEPATFVDDEPVETAREPEDLVGDPVAAEEAPLSAAPAAPVAGAATTEAAPAAAPAAAGPYGAGSAEPLADGAAPSAAYTVKGNADSMLFHTEDSPYYGRTRAEVWFDSESAARAAGFTRWDERDTGAAAGIASVPPGPYGPGSAEPLADGAAPSSAFTVKGNADSMLFHTEESPYYGRTKAEVWFDSESAARAAGFTRWDER